LKAFLFITSLQWIHWEPASFAASPNPRGCCNTY
jgi:hypothetical protein